MQIKVHRPGNLYMTRFGPSTYYCRLLKAVNAYILLGKTISLFDYFQYVADAHPAAVTRTVSQKT